MSSLKGFSRFHDSMPERVLEWFGAELIWQAIDGKYPGVGRTDVVSAISGQLGTAKNHDAYSDIRRQWKCLRVIEHGLRNRDISIPKLDGMYCILYGVESAVRRNDRLVLQDDLTETVSTDHIDREMSQFSTLLDEVNRLTMLSPLPKKLTIAAQVISELIRIHPYPDGNGRVARMTVNLAFRKWALPYVAIPKVRNNECWSSALHRAIRGDWSNARDFLEQLLQQSLRSFEKQFCQ